MNRTLWTFWHSQIVADSVTNRLPPEWKVRVAVVLLIILHRLIGKRNHRIVVHLRGGEESLRDLGHRLAAISSGQQVQVVTGNVHIKFDASVSDEEAASLQRAEIALSRLR